MRMEIPASLVLDFQWQNQSVTFIKINVLYVLQISDSKNNNK